MSNIIYAIITLTIIFITNIVMHELFHYLSTKIMKQKAIIHFGLDSYVELNDIEPKNKKLFYLSGMFGNLSLALICYICIPNIPMLWIYSLLIFIGNILLFFPQMDIYKAFIKIDQDDLNLELYGFKIFIGNVCILIWQILAILISILIF